MNLNEFRHNQLIYISQCIWQTCFDYLSPQQEEKGGEKKKKKKIMLRLAQTEGGE